MLLSILTRAWRGTIVVGALAGAAVTAASCATASVDNTPSCDAPKELCSGTCSDLQTDGENCGKCGYECPAGQACSGGKCATTCAGGDVICGGDGGIGKCVNTKSDNSNCGGCGKACPAGQICFGGTCQGTCGDSKSGQTTCKSDGGSPYCANLNTDNQNCGTCGKSCSSTQVCSGGQCASVCAGDQTMCGGDGGPLYCANLNTDDANCGACGVPCGSMQACIGGACVSQCSPYQTLCTPDGGAPYCADTQSDNTNCGTCGNVCPSNKPVCSQGKCTTGAQPPTCVAANGLTWCFDNTQCGNACTSVCSTLGMTTVDTTTWQNAQNTQQLCQNINNAFGLGGTVSVSSYSYACAEDTYATHAVNGGLVGPLLCSSYASCTTSHLTTMDQQGVACGPLSRRSVCACK